MQWGSVTYRYQTLHLNLNLHHCALMVTLIGGAEGEGEVGREEDEVKA